MNERLFYSLTQITTDQNSRLRYLSPRNLIRLKIERVNDKLITLEMKKRSILERAEIIAKFERITIEQASCWISSLT